MRILIGGGSGNIGRAISDQLQRNGHEVRLLSRTPGNKEKTISEYHWDIDRNIIDPAALEDVDSIINLAGAPINQKWSPQYKGLIVKSRVESTRLLYDAVRKNSTQLKSFIGTSAVGYYPANVDRLLTEDEKAGKTFLSEVCDHWERVAHLFENLDIRTVVFRVGVVLSHEGGALSKMAAPIKWGLGSPLGSGKQMVPWIHIDDLAAMFVTAVENQKLTGIYNAAGPKSVTNKELTRTIAKVLRKPLLLPPVPASVLKLMLGEMSEIALSGHNVDSSRIQETGFKYQHPDLESALKDLLL